MHKKKEMQASRETAKILNEAMKRGIKNATQQIRERGAIDEKFLGEAIESAFPVIPHPKNVGFFSEENALGIVMDDRSIKTVLVGEKIECFLCSEVIPGGPKKVIAWDDLHETWNGSQGVNDLAKFKKRMKDAINRINNRCGFTLFKWNKEGVFW